MLTPATIGLLIYNEDLAHTAARNPAKTSIHREEPADDGDVRPHYSLHRDKRSARAALATMLRLRWHRVAGLRTGGGDGLVVASDPAGLSDKKLIRLYFQAVNNATGTQQESWSITWLPVKLDLVAMPMTRASAKQAVRELWSGVDQFRTAVEGDDGDAEHAAALNLSTEAEYQAERLNLLL